MTIASALTAMNTDIVNARTAITNKGGTVTSGGGSSQLATDIATIPTGSAPVITSLNVTPTTSAQTITAPSGTDGYSPVNVAAVTAAIDANITAGNIKKDVPILGVTGTYEGSGGGTKYDATVNTLLGDVDANGVLQLPTEETDLVFTGVVEIGDNILEHKFSRCNIASVSFPDMRIIRNYGCNYAFNRTNVSSLSMPELTSIPGNYGCAYMFNYCHELTSVIIPKLSYISGSYACQRMFDNSGLVSLHFPMLATITGTNAMAYLCGSCTGITDIYFNALTTTSFGSRVNQFSNMMNGTGTYRTHTLHFPSNMESTISKLTGYPNFGGTSGYVVLAYDLPATS